MDWEMALGFNRLHDDGQLIKLDRLRLNKKSLYHSSNYTNHQKIRDLH